MKGLADPDLFAGSDGQNQANKAVHMRDFHAMLDEEAEESCQVMEKKRRLNFDQVKALEKNFEVDNKLEPERKLKLAQELGLQPRQVAVWFQNRRARWKTKQLERDYGVLKAEYDALKHSLEKLHHENETFLKEIEDLKSQLKEDGENGDDLKKQTLVTHPGAEMNVEIALTSQESPAEMKIEIRKEILGGNSDSDSSAIVNEDNSSSPTAAISSSNGHSPHQVPGSAPQINPSFEIYDGETIFAEAHKAYCHPHFVKIEEPNFLCEDSCSSFFAEDPAPSLHWYEWN